MHIRVSHLLMMLALAGCSSGSDPKVAGHGKNPGGKTTHGKSYDAGMDGGGDGAEPDSGPKSVTAHDASAQQPKPDGGNQTTQHPDACVSSSCQDAGTNSCENHELKSNAHFATHAANVLFVFDRSGSMTADWNGLPRWQAAGNAVQDALTPLADDFTAGAIFFPTADPKMCVDPTGISCTIVPGIGSCVVDPITATDQIAFASGSDFLSAFVDQGAGPRYAPVASGLTPLVEALKEAKTALSTTSLSGVTAVVIITDGEPNCAWDAAMARAIVSDWHTAGIDTYVVGLPGTDMAAATLSMLADAAGTTASQVTDSMALEQALSDVLSGARQPSLDSCTIELDAPAAKDAELHVIVTRDGKAYAADSGGWSLDADRGGLKLKGDLCAAAQNGEFTALKIVAGCVELPALPQP